MEKRVRTKSADAIEDMPPSPLELDVSPVFQPPFRPVGQLQLSEAVALHLREQIISGKLKAGEFLRIDAVARALNVSTTPVREGLLLLQSESFVRLMPRRGFVVNRFSKDDLRDLFWAQATVGAELAARAAIRLSEAEVERLEELHRRHERAVKARDQKPAARLGHEFHRAINLAAQSPRLALLMGSLAKQLTNLFYARIEGNLKDAIEYHAVILEALGARKAESARTLMHRHIVAAGEHLIAQLERQGVFGRRLPVASKTTTKRGPAKGARVAPKSQKKRTVARRR
jgi:DNA-binding GntR family transcriptional regulator